MKTSGLRGRSAALVLAAVAMLLLVGCGTGQAIPGASRDLLAFIEDGATTREEVVLRLGQPSASFEGDRILTYRIGEHATQGYYPIVPNQLMPWQSVSHSLVLVFDEAGVLAKHSLVAVR
jgi:hypothetical protein